MDRDTDCHHFDRQVLIVAPELGWHPEHCLVLR